MWNLHLSCARKTGCAMMVYFKVKSFITFTCNSGPRRERRDRTIMVVPRFGTNFSCPSFGGVDYHKTFERWEKIQRRGRRCLCIQKLHFIPKVTFHIFFFF